MLRNVTQSSDLDRLDSSGLGHGQVANSCEHGHEMSVHKRREIYRLGKQLLASQEGLFSMKLVTFISFNDLSI
jgi:hypothetical protein